MAEIVIVKKPAATRTKLAKASSAQASGLDHKPSAPPVNAVDAVDQQLAKYRSMRNFHVTEEPSGGASQEQAKVPKALPFCIQKHAASHLHYDFRLGWNGVLKSWACTKGPSYNVRDKRLAVQVEDHPMEYGGFEGIIPADQYGGGTVMLWDQGTWEPRPAHEDVNAGLRDGQLKFVLQGEKIKGKWALIRMGGKAATEKKPNWLLIKEHDIFELPPDAAAITEEQPRSIVTGRTMEQIARSEDHVWNSKGTARQNWYRQDKPPHEFPISEHAVSSQRTAARPASTRPWRTRLASLPDEFQPSFIKPQLATETSNPPDGSTWLHELKLDGYRIQARKEGQRVQMLTRSGLDWTVRVPAVAEAVSRIAASEVTLDGEVVVLREDGTTNFADLQASFQEGARNPLTYFCFDLLHLEGKSTRALPLMQRKDLLAQILSDGEEDLVRFSEHLDARGETIFRHACELHAEGIVSKRSDKPYLAGRSRDWLKSKCLHEQEFAVGGYTPPSNGSHGIGSLLLGYFLAGKLVYAGRTGTGFTQKMRRMLRDSLDAIVVERTPFTKLPVAARRDAIWVKPELVAQVRFATWTADDLVRQASFLGLREDKPASEVQRESPGALPTPKRSRRPQTKEHSAFLPSQPVAAFSVAHPLTDTKPARARNAKLPKTSDRLLKADRSKSAAPIRLTHPDKILDKGTGVTKQMLAEFYLAVAPRMLPHIAGRPLSLVRCPDGSEKPCFYQKHAHHLLPKGVHVIDVPDKKTGVLEAYLTLETPEALTSLAQMAVLEIHPWGSHNNDVEHPDRIIFDLDPDDQLAWEHVAAAAFDVRRNLQDLGLQSFLKTTGGKGLHLVVPILPNIAWSDVKVWTKTFVVAIESANPKRYLTKMTKAARTGKIYLDYLRNERGATTVAPYSPRARTGMGVSLPLAWEELRTTERPLFHVANFSTWRDRLDVDPWSALSSIHQSISPLS